MKVTDVMVSVGTVTSRDVKLELGASSEQVTVEAGQQLVQTEESSVSQLVDRRVWENMPLEARNANDFVNLVAGAVPEQIAGGTFRGAAVNGTRTGTGNFMVEGVDNNEQGQGGVSICGTACGQGGAEHFDFARCHPGIPRHQPRLQRRVWQGGWVRDRHGVEGRHQPVPRIAV